MQQVFKSRAPRGDAGGANKDSNPPGSPVAPVKAILDQGVVAQPSPFYTICSNCPARPTSPSLSGVEDCPDLARKAAAGSTRVPKSKSDVKKFSARSRGSGASKFSSTGLCRQLDQDLAKDPAVEHADVLASSPSGRSVPIRTPLSTARMSRHGTNSGELVVDRAARHAEEKDYMATAVEIID